MLDESQSMYNTEAGTYHVQPGASERPSTAAVLAVADIADEDPLEMEPANYGIDLEALDEAPVARTNGDAELRGSVTVTIEDHEVSLLPDGSLVVDPPGR